MIKFYQLVNFLSGSFVFSINYENAACFRMHSSHRFRFLDSATVASKQPRPVFLGKRVLKLNWFLVRDWPEETHALADSGANRSIGLGVNLWQCSNEPEYRATRMSALKA